MTSGMEGEDLGGIITLRILCKGNVILLRCIISFNWLCTHKTIIYSSLYWEVYWNWKFIDTLASDPDPGHIRPDSLSPVNYPFDMP